MDEPPLRAARSAHGTTLTALLVCAVAFAASGVSFFTGFGLGTLLLPAFALFFPVAVAVALTGVVHLLNSLFKLALVGRRADLPVAIRFGVPAIVAAVLGAELLVRLSAVPTLATWHAGSHTFAIVPVKLVVAVLMIGFAVAELVPGLKRLEVPARWLPVGGFLTGFFGGLSGHQGALRSMFLLRAGLSKEAFIATGVALAAVVDLSRLAVYAPTLASAMRPNAALLAAASASAFAGAALGNRLLTKVTLHTIELLVAVLLTLIALGLATGIL